MTSGSKDAASERDNDGSADGRFMNNRPTDTAILAHGYSSAQPRT